MKKNIPLFAVFISLLTFAACDNVSNTTRQQPITNPSNISALTDATTTDTIATDTQTLANAKKRPSLGLDMDKFKYTPKKKTAKTAPKPKQKKASTPKPAPKKTKPKPKPKPKKFTPKKQSKTPVTLPKSPKKVSNSPKNDSTPSNHSKQITSNTPNNKQQTNSNRPTESINSRPTISYSKKKITTLNTEANKPKTNTEELKLAMKSPNNGFSTQAVMPESTRQPKTHGLEVVKEDKDFYEGQIFIKVKKGGSVQLPEFNKSKGKNPNSSHPLNSVIQQYGIAKLYRPFTRLQSMSNVYKAEFKQHTRADNLIRTLQQLDYIESAEKVPIQKMY